MTRSPLARSSQIEWDSIAGIASFSSGRLTSVNGTVRTAFVAPFTGYVNGFDVNIDTAFTNAAARANMGTYADAQNDDLLDDFVIQNLTGYQNLIGSALWVSKAVTKGTLYGIGFTNADITGNGAITVTLGPVQSPA